ncbi:MAG: hypothetical protein MK198_10725 [Gracilimonas sp.]|uniref:hypothetical protein n=1 Tax=Gracilimonas sp. TaxID=1974203 RepID=UPI0037505864|nr:hypothetical protein [Gracilimonas sp.]
MIILYKKKGHKNSDELERRLEDLVISYKKEIHAADEPGLPYIAEDGNVYKTKEEIEEWLKELTAELNWQRSLSGDGCYIDPEKGKIC